MKKLQSLFVGIVVIILILLFGVRQLEQASGMSGAKIVTIYNWGDYVDPSLITKFEKEYDLEMSSVLKEMGMKRAFDSELAEFGGLGTSTSGNIYINRVLHKTFISVGEKGTKAGAATVVETYDKGMAEGVIELHLNRPFVYMLVDCENYIPFFIGTLYSVE